MPSPDLLPKGRSFPSVVVPSLDDVLKGARRRRTRQAGMVGVVAAAAVAAATIALVPHGSSDSLHSVTPTVGGNHSVSAPPAAHNSSTAAVRSGPAQVKVHRVAAEPLSPPAAKTKHQPPGNTTLYPKQSKTSDRATSVQGTVGPPHRITKFDATKGCTGTGPSPGEGWCSYYVGPTTGTAGHAVTLATAVCRLPGETTGLLRSRTGRQANFDVGKTAYRPVWRWSHGRTFSTSSTSMRVAAGTCVEWYVSWRVVDNAGQLLKPGQYYLDAWALMWDPNSPASAGTSSPITFTVR